MTHRDDLSRVYPEIHHSIRLQQTRQLRHGPYQTIPRIGDRPVKGRDLRTESVIGHDDEEAQVREGGDLWFGNDLFGSEDEAATVEDEGCN